MIHQSGELLFVDRIKESMSQKKRSKNNYICATLFNGSHVPHSSAEAKLMNMAFVKVALKCDFLHTGVNHCYIDSATLAWGFGKLAYKAIIHLL